jgi:hypothetical protein
MVAPTGRWFTPRHTMVPAIHSPADARRHLQSLAAWRWSALSSGLVSALLWATGHLTSAAGAVAVAAAVILAGGAEVARHVTLDEWALRDDLAGLPELARLRARLVDARHRRDAARLLREIAGQRSVPRNAVAPLLLTRLGPVRAELLAVAEDLERVPVLDPRTMADITGLISDGARSPLLNSAVPEPELAIALRRIRFRLAATLREDELRPAA